MLTSDFYLSLDYDFSDYEEEEELWGPTPGGFNSSHPLHIKSFDELELKAARDIIACYLKPVNSINKDFTSFSLKHLIERLLAKLTDGKINYVSNGSVILAMYEAGFRFKRKKGTPYCYFNVSKKCIKALSLRLDR